eukprot:199162-Rhodomonas_salina.2
MSVRLMPAPPCRRQGDWLCSDCHQQLGAEGLCPCCKESLGNIRCRLAKVLRDKVSTLLHHRICSCCIHTLCFSNVKQSTVFTSLDSESQTWEQHAVTNSNEHLVQNLAMEGRKSEVPSMPASASERRKQGGIHFTSHLQGICLAMCGPDAPHGSGASRTSKTCGATAWSGESRAGRCYAMPVCPRQPERVSLCFNCHQLAADRCPALRIQVHKTLNSRYKM